MNTIVLVIAADAERRASWSAAARAAGFDVRAVDAMLPAVDLLGTQTIDGMLVDARDEGVLQTLAAVSAYRPMPPTVIVHDHPVSVPARMRAAACRPTAATPERLVHLLGRLLDARELARPTNLPVRVTPHALKWTSRLSSPPLASDDDDSSEWRRREFDGETSPDGYDLASGS